jgi:hypothetical protein
MSDAAPFSVAYATVDGSAAAGVNYTATSGVLTFQPRQFYAAITIPVQGGRVPASGGTFSVVLSQPTGAALGPSTTLSVTIARPRQPATPSAPFLTGGVSTSHDIYLDGDVDPGATVHVYDGATLLGSTVASSFGSWFWNARRLSNGVHSFTTIVEDA